MRIRAWMKQVNFDRCRRMRLESVSQLHPLRIAFAVYPFNTRSH